MTQQLSPQQTPGVWNAVAPTYGTDAWQWTAYMDEALRLVPVGTAARVLDVACGPGTLAFRAAALGASVDAVDFSPGMIEQVRARALESGASVHGAVMDAGELAFADAAFDAAFCMFAFFFFPDRGRAFRELFRVLKPGARALFATWCPIDRRPIMKVGFEAMAEALPWFPQPSKGDLQDPDECVREMSAAGFRDVSARLVDASVRLESPEHYFDMLARSAAPLAAMRQNIGEDAFSDLRGKVIEALRSRIPATGVELGAEAILTVGTRA